MEADSAIEAAQRMSSQNADPRRSIYTVQAMVRLDAPVRVTI